jgi:hypothetical protein
VFKVLVLVALFALAVYLLVRLIQRRGILDIREARRPYAPDDDPDFLRDLDRKRLHPDDPEG